MIALFGGHYAVPFAVTKKTYFIGSALVVLLAALLRLYNLGGTSLWFDEAVYANNALGSFAQFLHNTRESNSSPIMLPSILWVLGERIQDAFWIRFIPAACGILTVVVLLALPTIGVSRPVSFWSGLWLAILPFHIQYSQEVREYSLSALVSAILLLCFFGAITRSDSAKVYQCALGFAVFLAPLCSYGSLFYAVILILFYLLVVAVQNRFSISTSFFMLFALSAGTIASYYITARYQMGVANAWYLLDGYPPSELAGFLFWLAKANVKYMAFLYGGILAGVVASTALLCFAVVAISRRHFTSETSYAVWTFLLLVLACNLLAVFGMYPHGGIRQHLFAVPAAVVAAVSAIVWLGERTQKHEMRASIYGVACLVFAVSALFKLPAAYGDSQDIVTPVQHIDQFPEEASVFVYYAAVPAVQFHYRDKQFFLSQSERGQLHKMVLEIEQMNARGIYLLFSHVMLEEDDKLLGMLQGEGYRLLQDKVYAGSRLVLVQKQLSD